MDSRPSSAPMFRKMQSFFGDLDEDADTNFITMDRGANQFLGHQANHHNGQSTLGPRGNRVQDGQVPRVSGPVIGAPDAANPLGRGSSSSLNG